jgi:hypothetical protein
MRIHILHPGLIERSFNFYELSVVSPIQLLKHDHCPSVYSYDLIVVSCLVI